MEIDCHSAWLQMRDMVYLKSASDLLMWLYGTKLRSIVPQILFFALSGEKPLSNAI